MQRTTGRSRAIFALLVLTLAVATATTAWAGDVRGTLRLQAGYGAPAPEANARSHYWEEWNGFIEPTPHRFDAGRELAVVLTGPGEPAADQPNFALANGALSPATLVVRAGATLRIENSDPVAHQLYAEGSEELAPTPTSAGLVRQQVLSGAGAWPLRDQLHPHVTGHLHVLTDLIARAEVQGDGTFRFRNVPAGTYTLTVFHREHALHSAEVTVPEDRELVVDPIAIGATPAQ